MRYVDVNLNNYIKVKLTEDGLRAWKEHDDFYLRESDLLEEHSRPIEHYQNQVDQDGYVSFQIHHFMHVFGDFATVDADKYFGMRVQVEVN